MFHKPAQVKPYASIKGSERKQLLAKLEAQAGQPVDQALVPKSVQSAKSILRNGRKAQIYAAEGKPLFVSFGEKIVPTVLSVAQAPQLLPTVWTVPNTLKFLVSGADFMIPGIYGDVPDVKAGNVVQIRELDQGRLLAVGLTLVDLGGLKQDDKGKAVEIVNVRGDTLVPENLMPEDLGVFEGAGGAEGGAQGAQEGAQAGAEGESAAPTAGLEALSTKTSDDVPLTTQEADDAFMYAAPRALAVPAEYPMPSATFAKQLGAHFPYEHPEMLVKNTSWKKLPKFLAHLEKEGLVKIRERNGDTIIESTSVEPIEEAATKTKSNAKSGTKKLEIELVYKVRSSGSEIAPTAPYLVAGDLKKYLVEYVEKAGLRDKAQVKVDDVLRKACGYKQDVEQAQINDAMAEFVRHSTQQWHRIGGELKKGPIPSIVLSTERKGGNKVVTKVMGMEAFGFAAKQFAEHLRVACAGSTTVSETKAGKNTKPQPIVQIQGDHVAKVTQYLEAEGVKSSWIKVEKSKK